ncbi:pirin family protein [Terriglobus albidus]|uniref:Pirin family protein n=1 Tax=Terriglobus albidus TaxID=1592106 RepID=A0A5B9EK59_9BACT|nr:pirin family protein [Terriglobus albidus]QEE30721.1 pirin family protein [Terriglobus albidus]
MAVLTKLDRSMKRRHGSSAFGIDILYPGLVLEEDDSGIGAIGRIDQAWLQPGAFIAMHPHRNDEILTYLRSGRLQHRDSVGHVEELSNTRLMLMNAGHTFQHEERVPADGGALEALQIFIRPSEKDLEPVVQFHDFAAAFSENDWRLVAGPNEDAPLKFRAQVWVHDIRLTTGHTATLPPFPTGEVSRILYVFAGRIAVAGTILAAGESILLNDEDLQIAAQEDSDLVLFTTDPSAPVFKQGMFSGNIVGFDA